MEPDDDWRLDADVVLAPEQLGALEPDAGAREGYIGFASVGGRIGFNGYYNFEQQPTVGGGAALSHAGGQLSGKVHFVTAAPSATTADGDIWYVYVP